MKLINALLPLLLTLTAFFYNSANASQPEIVMTTGTALAVLWLLFILLVRTRRVLDFYLLSWFIMTMLVLLRIKIKIEGVIELPAVFDWLSNTIILPFLGLVNYFGVQYQWETATLLGTLFVTVILVRIQLVNKPILTGRPVKTRY
ncbi:hypothetical protein [Proteiniclasticum sp. QWL-01]|uniref:hypothetical protein n=1 Tax=Proteiniclasticum sp. QWL-01 TaxID=3036945 RepID=UPI0021F95799|nr:hypothetical protein [Proteiniclasticum sp. QWL-01]UUM12643.1 hypothetical protein NQU17_03520 [Clostridiaceae bacterium HFYG-1003]WFF74195.1 hypothetical protein P6M73_07030 [Proteiniclasticum sp. QWL-01]